VIETTETGPQRGRPNRSARTLALGLGVVVLVAALVAVLAGTGSDRTSLPVLRLSRVPVGEADTKLADAATPGPRIQWKLGVELPDLGSTAPVHQLHAPDIDAARVRHIAEVLGVTGEPEQHGGSWSVSHGSDVLGVNCTGVVCMVETGAIAQAERAASGASSGSSSSSASPSDDAGVASPPPTTSSTAAPPPDADVERAGRSLLDRLDITTSGEWRYRVITTGTSVSSSCSSDGKCDEQTTSTSRGLSAVPLVDGFAQPSLGWTLTVAVDGTVPRLFGVLTDVGAGRDYPLRSTKDAFDDLVAGKTVSGPGSWLVADPEADARTAAERIEPRSEATVRKVALGAAALAGTDGSDRPTIYLVPVYVFADTEAGMFEAVLAIDPSLVDLTPPAAVEPQPAPDTPVATMVAPAPPAPVEPAFTGEEAEVATTFHNLFDGRNWKPAEPDAISKSLQGGAGLVTESNEALKAAPSAPSTYSPVVRAVAIDGDHAEVDWVLTSSGTPVITMPDGAAEKVDGHWVVARATFCRVIASVGVNCPPQ
jgi:hypothetical protein